VNEKLKAEKSYQLIRKDFEIGDDFDASIDNPFDQLLSRLTQIIKHLLDQDFSQLLIILYRIDVPESKVKRMLEISPPEELASDIAQAIIERQLQKVELRMKYHS
jgi:hypothetical protein